jgi:tRNA(fMet)-specific endonuclease VapC
MKYLLDTDTCVFWLRGHPPVREHLAEIDPQTVAISVVTLAELRYGAAYSARPHDNHQAINAFIFAIPVLDLVPEAADAFGDLKSDLRRKGLLIEDMDLLIAATALAHDLTLVTNNMAHFERIPHLRLENWVAPA